MSCHPSHTKEIEERARRYQEAQERTLEQQKRDLTPDPRKIHRQHRWKLGHDPAGQDEDADPNVVYLQMEGREAPPTEPDQRDLLTGGPESGLPCARCNTMTTVGGETTMWELYNQPNVSVVNLDSITESRRKELQEMRVVILCCPNCHLKTQWLEEFLPRKLGHGA